jgi:hypothetical protein
MEPTSREALVERLQGVVQQELPRALASLPDHDRLRLAGLESFVRGVMTAVLQAMWLCIVQSLQAEAERAAQPCGCGRRREARVKRVGVHVLGTVVPFLCTYFYCRVCRLGESPVRRWLGIEEGATSMVLERKLTDLTERMTFGDAVRSLEEQQGQCMDRTQAERITYGVCDEVEIYLAERRQQALDGLGTEQRTAGVEQLLLTADGGAVPLGELRRPDESECTEHTERTPVRKLPKGTRTIQGREARLIVVREADKVTERTVDCHIAPYGKTEFSGERMLAAAAQTGLGDQTKVHGVFDMGSWIHTQFEEQFHAYSTSACADICHVTEYLADAARELHGSEQAKSFAMQNKDHLLDGELSKVQDELHAHECDDDCLTDERDDCLVRVAERYLRNHARYLDYPPILEQNLPVGSGEAESGIRHLIKKRLDVAGAWTEANAKRMLALIAMRASGLWEDFWCWRDQRDIEAWHQRQRGQGLPRFRGRPAQAA